MSIYHKGRAGARGGKDQFNWDTVKSDKDRECYLGHSVMAPTGRWQEGKDLTWYAKDRENEDQTKSAEFRAAKKVEEEALMAALGMKVLPPPATPARSIQSTPVIKREPQSALIKNEPMTPAIHSDSRNAKHHHQHKKHDNQRKEDRRRRRQLKATASDEEKHDWSEDDEDDLLPDDDDEDKTKGSLSQDTMTEKDLDEFLVDLVKKHGLKIIQRALKSKKDKKERERKRKHSPTSSSASESEEDQRERKHKHKKKHSRKEESNSKEHQRARESSPSSRKDRSKHHSRS